MLSEVTGNDKGCGEREGGRKRGESERESNRIAESSHVAKSDGPRHRRRIYRPVACGPWVASGTSGQRIRQLGGRRIRIDAVGKGESSLDAP